MNIWRFPQFRKIVASLPIIHSLFRFKVDKQRFL